MQALNIVRLSAGPLLVLLTLALTISLPITQGPIWTTGWVLSMLLGVSTFALALREGRGALRGFASQSEERLNQIIELSEQVRLSEERWAAERAQLMASLEEVELVLEQHHKALREKCVEIERLQKLQAQADQDKRTLLEEIYELQRTNLHVKENLQEQVKSKEQLLEAAEERLKAIQSEHEAKLNGLAQECTAYREKAAALEQAALIAKARKKEERVPLTDPEREFRRMEGLYKQLRQQFEAKTDQLSEVRKQLFTAQEGLAAYMHAEALQEEGFSEIEQILMRQIAESEAERQQVEEEVLALEKLLSCSLKRT